MAVPVRTDKTDFAEAGQLASAGDYLALMKPRVMSLVIFTCLAGMYLSGANAHPVLALISLLAISVGAGASGAINQFYDRDMDLVMARTRNRPLPAGKIAPAEALSFGLIAAILSVLVLAFSAGYLAAGLLAFTIFFYAVIYTIWLKRRTPQNIVIGGAAGALPPLVGWAAVTGEVTINSLLLFAIIFFWTPPHFWALALFRHDDYKRAGVPMLPVVAGARETRKQILIYALILAPLAVMPVATSLASVWYGLGAGGLGLVFIGLAWQLMRFGDEKRAIGLFKYSIFYLFLIFAGLMADQAVRSWL